MMTQGRFRPANGKGNLLGQIPLYPKGRPASLAYGFPPGPVRPEARLNSHRANVAVLEQAAA
ncbi:hypothetical protein B0T40_05530 [Chromobacterium haemolyticum]|uniref:Uncharacterized protein n=1 Tax=Chromobacterium rhizoryzae TaxID=1778675 RepID=A0AAD0RTM8_9NEIS|nr:hypothetical protein D1345_11930 [Chromobacterium rhizoryzae]OQS38395.1 hypothetical protein B0T40_05530 [Chromobacterium haemolyticum]